MVKHRKVEPIALTADEIVELSAKMPPRWSAMVALAGFSGLRWGELAALQRRDLVLTEAECSVTVARAVVRAEGRFITDRPKSTAALRTVPLPDQLRAILTEHVEAFSAPGPTGLVFPAASGDVLNRDTVKTSFTEAATAIGYSTLRIHDHGIRRQHFSPKPGQPWPTT